LEEKRNKSKQSQEERNNLMATHFVLFFKKFILEKKQSQVINFIL
jgi:hypothetical protein